MATESPQLKLLRDMDRIVRRLNECRRRSNALLLQWKTQQHEMKELENLLKECANRYEELVVVAPGDTAVVRENTTPPPALVPMEDTARHGLGDDAQHDPFAV